MRWELTTAGAAGGLLVVAVVGVFLWTGHSPAAERRKPMEVNGLPLPAALVRIIRDGQGKFTYWMMKDHVIKERVDAYGEYFDGTHLDIFDYDTIAEKTAKLPTRFVLPSEANYNYEAGSPGFLPLIRDHSKIVVFGEPGSGEPFCLDYRDNPQEPKVIWFDSYAYWRRVAPNFVAFLELLEPYDQNEFERRITEKENQRRQADRNG
jgi:hypothetical protein